MQDLFGVGECIPIDVSDIKSCNDFGYECQMTTDYAYRGQHDADKIRRDHVYGKIGEWAAYKMLIPFYPYITEPDMKIYHGNQKGWEPDLIDMDTGVTFAVKTQESYTGKVFGVSWIFGKNDHGINSDYDNMWAVLVTLDIVTSTAIIMGVVRVKWLHDNKLFKPLKIDELNKTKKAVYYNDIKHLATCQI